MHCSTFIHICLSRPIKTSPQKSSSRYNNLAGVPVNHRSTFMRCIERPAIIITRKVSRYRRIRKLDFCHSHPHHHGLRSSDVWSHFRQVRQKDLSRQVVRSLSYLSTIQNSFVSSRAVLQLLLERSTRSSERYYLWHWPYILCRQGHISSAVAPINQVAVR